MAANGKRARSDHDEPSPAAATASFAQFWPSSHEPGTSSHEPAATAAAALSHQPAATSALALSHEPPATDASVSALRRPFDPEIDCAWTIAGVCCSTEEMEAEILVGARWERLVAKLFGVPKVLAEVARTDLVSDGLGASTATVS